jgi:hypothetical protein
MSSDPLIHSFQHLFEGSRDESKRIIDIGVGTFYLSSTFFDRPGFPFCLEISAFLFSEAQEMSDTARILKSTTPGGKTAILHWRRKGLNHKDPMLTFLK